MAEFRAHRYKFLRHNVNRCVRCGMLRKLFKRGRFFILKYQPIPSEPWKKAEGWQTLRPRCIVHAMSRTTARFESGFDLLHCGKIPKLLGNYSLREAGAANTRIGYECIVCFQRFTIVDELPPPGQVDLADIDATE